MLQADCGSQRPAPQACEGCPQRLQVAKHLQAPILGVEVQDEADEVARLELQAKRLGLPLTAGEAAALPCAAALARLQGQGRMRDSFW